MVGYHDPCPCCGNKRPRSALERWESCPLPRPSSPLATKMQRCISAPISSVGTSTADGNDRRPAASSTPRPNAALATAYASPDLQIADLAAMIGAEASTQPCSRSVLSEDPVISSNAVVVSDAVIASSPQEQEQQKVEEETRESDDANMKENEVVEREEKKKKKKKKRSVVKVTGEGEVRVSFRCKCGGSHEVLFP